MSSDQLTSATEMARRRREQPGDAGGRPAGGRVRGQGVDQLEVDDMYQLPNMSMHGHREGALGSGTSIGSGEFALGAKTMRQQTGVSGGTQRDRPCMEEATVVLSVFLFPPGTHPSPTFSEGTWTWSPIGFFAASSTPGLIGSHGAVPWVVSGTVFNRKTTRTKSV